MLRKNISIGNINRDINLTYNK